jgi:class 3 adenylate cyclase
MQQTADWLQKLGLGQYAQGFAENHISFAILSDLTDQDLEKIGVASLGHRRRLLREIANLGRAADAAPSVPSGSAPPIAPIITPSAEAVGERRHVTVMFCDLVDSTGISAKLER